MEKSTNFKKNFIWNILGTGLNSFNSLFFMIAVTRINGIDEAGIFTIAFSTACIVYVIGFYSGRVYQVTETDKSISDKDYIVNRLISFVLMIIATLIFVIARGYDQYKFIIFILLALFKGLEAISDVLYGIMQKNDLLHKTGKSYFIKSLVSIIVFIIVDLITKNLIITCVSIIAVWIFFILIYDIPNVIKLIDRTQKVKIENVLKIFKNGFFVFAISFLTLYLTNAPKYAIDNYLSNDIQTIFGIVIMPATVIVLFGQFLIQPYLNTLVQHREENNYEQIKKIERKLILYIICFGVISSILAYLVGTQVLGFIYGLDLSNYKIALAAIIIASTLYTCAIVYSNILTTLRKTFIQFIIYILISIGALILCNVLTASFEIKGAIIAYFVIMLIFFIAYFITEKTIIKKEEKLNEQ